MRGATLPRLVVLGTALSLGLILYTVLLAEAGFGRPQAGDLLISPTTEGPGDRSAGSRQAALPQGSDAAAEAQPATAPQPTAQPPLAEPGRDLADALLLRSSQKEYTNDKGFRKAVAHYGLTLAEVDLAKTTLADALLRDERGSYYPTIYVAGEVAAGLDEGELAALKKAVAAGANLLVAAVQQSKNKALAVLTDGAITGATLPADSRLDFRFGEAAPEVTRELTGVAVVHERKPTDYALSLGQGGERTQVLATATDDAGATYPLFARYQAGKGYVFALGDKPEKSLDDNTLFENFYPIKQSGDAYKADRLVQVLPYLVFVRYAAGDEAWHRERDFANLTIDDPPLRKASLDFAGLLAESVARDFHVTIALPPDSAGKDEEDVVRLFRDNPDRLSLAQHGNEHDGYEFYKYETRANDEHEARPLEDQEADIVEGRTRLLAYARRTGIPAGNVMVFPYGISPAPTLALLKQYNYLATVNAQDVPLGEQRLRTSAAHMYPAELGYGGLAVVLRHQPNQAPYPFDLFLDKPALVYEHPGAFQSGGPKAFNKYADKINALHGEVEWQSLDHIAKRLYLQKTNDDGSVDVLFFAGRVVVTNDAERERTFHLRRQEDLALPIARLTVDGRPAAYAVENGVLRVDLDIPAGGSRELAITYGATEHDFALGPADVAFDGSGLASATVRNQGRRAGPVTVGFFAGSPSAGGELLALETAPRVEPGGAASLRVSLGDLGGRQLTVVVDPFDVIVEADEGNNAVGPVSPS